MMSEVQGVIGLDLSLTSTGVVGLRLALPRNPQIWRLQSAYKGVKRLSDLCDQLDTAISGFTQDIDRWLWEDEVLAVIEGYSMGSRVGQAFSIGEWGGVARLLLHDKRLPFIEVPPSTLKKWITGKGNAPKDQMRLSVYKKWDFEADSNDVIDAYALAQFGRAYLAIRTGALELDEKAFTKAEMEQMSKFIKKQEKE